MLEDITDFEMAYSVHIDSSRVLELWVDEIETGDSVWQTTTATGQVIERSDRYEDQALCLRDGLNKALPLEPVAASERS